VSTEIPAEAVDLLQAIYATLRRSDDLAAERVATALAPVMRASAATCRSALTTSATRPASSLSIRTGRWGRR
jgi:hypothetical protein